MYQLRAEVNGELSRAVLPSVKERVRRRLEAIKRTALTVGDFHIERIAFWSLDGHPIKQRWMERLLESQGADGGWVVAPSYGRRLQHLFGLDQREEVSGVHVTFLAVLAISHYQAKIDNDFGTAIGSVGYDVARQ